MIGPDSGVDTTPRTVPLPTLMGIVNVTPDSFSDGGRFVDPEQAVAHGRSLVDEGATWLDVGGESTRPGAEPVSVDDEIARVVPVLRGLADACPGVTLSVDTSKAAVAEAALAAGAHVVNDVTALGDPGMLDVVVRAQAGLVLMHMRGTPRTMQADTHYDDLVATVEAYLRERLEVAQQGGVAPDRLWIDPGIGFGKASAANCDLVRATSRLRALGAPVVIGASRKSFIGAMTGVQASEQRVFGSVGVALAAALRGADVLRVHDVAATRRALIAFCACA